MVTASKHNAIKLNFFKKIENSYITLTYNQLKAWNDNEKDDEVETICKNKNNNGNENLPMLINQIQKVEHIPSSKK